VPGSYPYFDYNSKGQRVVLDTFSLKREKWKLDGRTPYASVFEVCEAGQRYLYCQVDIAPEIFPHSYFVRILSFRTGPLIRVDYIKERRQQFFKAGCGFETSLQP
jgi:hypothetical protein